MANWHNSIAIILALCLGVVSVPSENLETESKSAQRVSEDNTARLILISRPNVLGTNEAKVKLSVPSEPGDNFSKKAMKTHQAITSMISKIDATPAFTLKTLPFINMANWEKYSAIGCREFFKTKRNYDKDLYNEYMKEVPVVLGTVHDETLAQAVDEYDDNVLEERELFILRKIKRYFKIAAEGYLRIPLEIDSILYKLEESDESDMYIFGAGLERWVAYVVKENVPKALVIDIECYLDQTAMDLSFMQKPNQELEKFVKKNKLCTKDYTSKEDVKLWTCNAEEKDKIFSSFVLLEYNKIYTKPEAEPVHFQWIQTYHSNKRMIITDAYRLRFNVYERTEPSDEEKAKIKKEKEAKLAKKKRREERRKRNKARELRNRRRQRRDETDSDETDSDEDDSDEGDSDGSNSDNTGE